jgi:ABC-2 type transport system ATP-binding protein
MPALQLTDLRKQYRGALVPALDGLSFSVARGTIVGLLGPNGAGKTTSINIICGLVDADGGEAKVMGLDAGRDRQEIRRKIGVVPQQIALFGNLTGRENFRYIGRLYGLSDAMIQRRTDLLLGRMGLEGHADKRVSRYSGGMKRRANIIATLLHDPELLILDEPTAGVDVQSRALILDFLKEYHSQGKTILYTSHLLDEAEQLCEEVVIVDEGRFITQGTPRALVAQTPDSRRLEDVFLHFTGHSVRD